MKKNLLSLFLLLFTSAGLYATELNIYASGLNATQSNGSSVTIDYVLNATATELHLKLYKDADLKATIEVPAGDGNANYAKGSHSVVIDLSGVDGDTYTWAMEARAAANGAASPVRVTDDANQAYHYFLPQDVVVDNNPESSHFGCIYVSESCDGIPSGQTGAGYTYATQHQTRGIYIYNTDLSFINPEDNTYSDNPTALQGYYDHSIVQAATTGELSDKRSSFKRLAIDEKGYVYVASQHSNNKGVYRMNPSTHEFEVVLSASAAVDAIEVVDGYLYTLEGITSGGGGNYKKYSLGELPVVSASATASQSTLINFVNSDCSWRSDHHDGFWGCESVLKGANPNIVHINSSGSKDYEITNSTNSSLLAGSYSSKRGTIGISPAGNLLAVGYNAKVIVFEISYPEGVLTLEPQYEIAPTTSKGSSTNIDGIAFDVADNLYIVSGSVERFFAYATPKAAGENKYETPAPSANKISVSVPHICAYDLNVTFNDAYYTFSFKSNLATTDAALEFYDASTGAKVGDDIPISVSKGSNNININIEDLPGTLGQEMTWKVRLTGPENAAFSLIHEAEAITHERGAFVAVDASPKSNYFGRIYYFNRRMTDNTASGLYFYTPDDFTPSTIARFGESSDTNIGIMHISVDEDGKIWGIDYVDAHPGVYIITPGEGSSNYSYQNLFAGNTINTSNGKITNGSGTIIGGNGTGCFIYGSGSNKVLYTTQEDFAGQSTNPHPIAVYNLQGATSWSEAPTYTWNIKNRDGHNSIFVVKEGIWITQSNSKNNSSTDPSLQFISRVNGTVIKSFHDNTDIVACAGAGMTVDTINNKLYMADNSGNILEFNITYTAGEPSLSLVAEHVVGYSYIPSMCLDYAGNLCITAGNEYPRGNTDKDMRLMVYSPATDDNTTTVPGKSTKTVVKATSCSRTINNLSTICLPYAVAANDYDGTTVYSVLKANKEGGVLQSITLQEVEGALVAGTPYIIVPEASPSSFTYTYSGSAASDSIRANGLVGKLTNKSQSVPDDGSCYIFHGGQLHKVTEGVNVNFVQHRAYFDVDECEDLTPAQGAPGRRTLTITAAPETTTDIKTIEGTAKAVKFFENGQLYILRDGVVYDAVGRQVR